MKGAALHCRVATETMTRRHLHPGNTPCRVNKKSRRDAFPYESTTDAFGFELISTYSAGNWKYLSKDSSEEAININISINEIWDSSGPLWISIAAIIVAAIVCMIIIAIVPDNLKSITKKSSAYVIIAVFLYAIWVTSGMWGSS